MHKQISLTLLLFTGLLSHGQIGGRGVYEFLNLVTSPRQAALGGKVITIFDEDVNTGHFNPATINPDMDNRFSLNYGNYYGEVKYGTASYAYVYDRHVQTIWAGVNYINYGTFEGYDENGVETSDFTGNEVAVSVGYSYNVPNSDIYIGATGKLITSKMETYTSFGGALDIGAIYIDTDNDINYAVSVRNLGTQITTYAGTREQLPFEVMAGISQEVENVPIRWHLTLENLQQWNVSFSNPARAESNLDGETVPEKVSFFNNALRHVIFGLELFPQKSINIRIGYNFRRGEELRILEQRNFSGISAGIGIKLNRLKFNYSYSRYTLAANTSLFGLTINFGDEDY